MTTARVYNDNGYYAICNDGIITCNNKNRLLNYLKEKNYNIIIIEKYFIERLGKGREIEC